MKFTLHFYPFTLSSIVDKNTSILSIIFDKIVNYLNWINEKRSIARFS